MKRSGSTASASAGAAKNLTEVREAQKGKDFYLFNTSNIALADQQKVWDEKRELRKELQAALDDKQKQLA
jgi:hypothetical protein